MEAAGGAKGACGGARGEGQEEVEPAASSQSSSSPAASLILRQRAAVSPPPPRSLLPLLLRRGVHCSQKERLRAVGSTSSPAEACPGREKENARESLRWVRTSESV